MIEEAQRMEHAVLDICRQFHDIANSGFLLGYKYSNKKKPGLVLVNLTAAANDTLYGTATSPANLFVTWSAYTQLQLQPHHWHWPPKKITTLEKRSILGIGLGNSPLQHYT